MAQKVTLHDLATAIVELKALRARIPHYYVKLLTWRQENGVIKAYPKRLLSDAAHKAILREFKRFGGKFVSHNREHYFELMNFRSNSTSTEAATKIKTAFEELQTEAK